MADYEDNKGYGKRPLWQWILMYAVVAAVVYGLIYYFILAKRGANYIVPSSSPVANSLETPAPSATASAAVQQGQNTVTLTSSGFSPATLTIKAGDAVTWVNNNGANATVNSAPHPAHTDYPPLNLGVFADGQSLSLTFNKAGSYKYHNHLNSAQFGTIVVE